MQHWADPQPSSQQIGGVLGLWPNSTQQAHFCNWVEPVFPPMSLLTFSKHYTLFMSSPTDQWYVDIGATSHMTANGGNLSFYFNLSNTHKFTIGNGNSIPIHGSKHTIFPHPFPPLSLNNILHASHLIKNLVYVCQFIVDNNVFIEFDPFGFLSRIFRHGF